MTMIDFLYNIQPMFDSPTFFFPNNVSNRTKTFLGVSLFDGIYFQRWIEQHFLEVILIVAWIITEIDSLLV